LLLVFDTDAAESLKPATKMSIAKHALRKSRGLKHFGVVDMPTFKIAHVREQGVDLIIIPMERSFAYRPSSDQQAIIAQLQAYAISAKLAGTVTPVWDYGQGEMGFIAPESWHPFFQSIGLSWVSARLNRELHIVVGGKGDRAAVALDITKEAV